MTNSTDSSGYLTVVRVAFVAGAFSAIVAALLLYDFVVRGAKHPAEAATYQAFTQALRDQPDNDTLKAHLRLVDEQLRREYFRQRAFSMVGTVLLLCGVAVTVFAAKSAATLRRELPQPGVMPPRDIESQRAQAARWAVGALAVLLLAGAVALGFGLRAQLPRGEKELAALLAGEKEPDSKPAPINAALPTPPPSPKTESPTIQPTDKPTPGNGAVKPPRPDAVPPKPDEPTATPTTDPSPPPTAAETLPSAEEYNKAWPRFRGPAGLGISPYENIPTKWDGESGEGIRWKTAVPLPGNNSPVVWSNRVFLSGANEKQREVYCFDADSGELVWKQPVTGTPESNAAIPKVMDDTGFAAPTVATDGRRVYAIFANGDVAAFTVEGKPAWSKSLGLPDNSYGHAGSLLVYKDLLIVPFDQGRVGESKSRLFALKAATGEVAWQAERNVPNSWSTPIVAHIGQQDQIITAADPWAIAYDPKNGREIWRAKVLKQDVGPSPVFSDGKVYTTSEQSQLIAIKVGSEGDLTKDKDTAKKFILWKGEDNLPDTASPLATPQFVFVLASSGIMTCYDAKSGDMRWEMEFDDVFSASPSLVGNKLLLVGKEGKCWWVEPSEDEGKKLSEAAMGEECVTSPAFQDGRIYLRGKTHLFCIGK